MRAGIKYDSGKPIWSLLPYDALAYVVKVMMFGASKYGAGNWRRLEDAPDRYFSALMRHVVAWRNGERLDPETLRPHLAHAATNAIFPSWFELKALKLVKSHAVKMSLISKPKYKKI